MLPGLVRRSVLVVAAVGLVGAAAVIAFTRTWEHDGSTAGSGEVTVQRATLRASEILLVVVNNSEETARVAQVILNDAFVDFRQSRREVRPGDAERVTIVYPWVGGESYDVQLLTATGATIGYEIEDAAAGTLAA